VDPETASAKGNGHLTVPIMTALLSWGAISFGFLGLKLLMQERPEFVGQPMLVTQAELVQESPQVITRKVSDDISAIKLAQPESSDVRFEMNGRRDYRGLRTIRDMSGEFRASYLLTNSLEEPIFVLFKSPHPRTENGDRQSLLAGDLKLQSSAKGIQDNTTNAWFWSGTLDPRSSANIDVSYHVASLKGVTYRVSAQGGNQVKHSRVSFHRKDLGSMRFESGDGTRRPREDTVILERRDFLAPDFFSATIEESRNLYSSLSQLLEIGPIICLLFLLAVSAVILVRQEVTAIQMLTIAAGYAFYFPLILYLSANFNFVWALLLALVIPGVLLVNYARWLLGTRVGLLGAAAFLCLYQVFPTLAAFAGWKRGMVLLSLGIVTLAVLINLQNRLLRRRPAALATAAAMLVMLGFTSTAVPAELQVILPAELARKSVEPKRENPNPLVAFEPGRYQIRQEGTHFCVEAQLALQVMRIGENPLPLFTVPVYVQESKPSESNVARLGSLSNRLALVLQNTGHIALQLIYRVPIENREGKRRAQIPLASGIAGSVQLESPRGDLEILTGGLWNLATGDKKTTYDIGVAGEETLLVEWRSERGSSAESTSRPGEGAKEFYGIGITRGQNLTLINSDGSCTHFAEFEIPVSQPDEFRMKLPPKARLISVSVNGAELSSPSVEEQLCRIRLPAREAQQVAHRLSFRIAYPVLRLGFVGSAELTLPELFQTAGTLEWVIALPNGFQTQVISSGLEPQKSSPDLGRFGDYGRILKSHRPIFLAKDLTPPGSVTLSLKYRQMIPGVYEASTE
jgi:hypothetical protein